MRSYNAILSLDSLLAADTQDTIYAGLSQALEHMRLRLQDRNHSCQADGTDARAQRPRGFPHIQEHHALPRAHGEDQ